MTLGWSPFTVRILKRLNIINGDEDDFHNYYLQYYAGNVWLF